MYINVRDIFKIVLYIYLKHTSSIPAMRNFSGLFWVFWDLLLFLSSSSAILLGDVIAYKNERFTKKPMTFVTLRVDLNPSKKKFTRF